VSHVYVELYGMTMRLKRVEYHKMLRDIIAGRSLRTDFSKLIGIVRLTEVEAEEARDMLAASLKPPPPLRFSNPEVKR